jgi:transposase
MTPLIRGYKGGGTSSYHPEMMLKIMVYGYINKRLIPECWEK